MRYVDSKALKKAMVEVGIDSYIQLEEASGVYRSTLSSIVKGEQKPSYDTVVALTDTLHLRYDEIGSIFYANELTAE